MIRRLTSVPLVLILVAISVSVAGAAPSGPDTPPDEPTAEQVPPDGPDPDTPQDTEDPAVEGEDPAGTDQDSTDPEDAEDVSDDPQPAEDPVDAADETPDIEPPSKRERRIPNRYIVVFKKSVGNVDRETDELESEDPEGFQSRLRYKKAIKGFTATLSPRQVARLQDRPEVDFITPDRVVKATGSVLLAGGEPLPPPGIRRIEAATSVAAHQSSGVNVAVIDTGIQLGHPDLNAVHGTDCVDPGTQAGDGNGHGTHVAGTIAARNNGSGVMGVAPNTKLYAVRVLNDSGSGSASQVICGIDWVTANASALNIKVVNMSLGGGGQPVESCSTTTDAEHKAICRSTEAGVTYVVAAGNEDWEFDYGPAPDTPAAYPQVLTVTATSDTDGVPGGAGPNPSCRSGEADDRYASFSSFAGTSAGEAHTIAAPGVCIKSTWKGGGYKTISGTSMAAPHVAGSVALCLNEGGASGPCSGPPAQVIQQMRSRAEDHLAANAGFGFTGDPSDPVSGRYFGHLDWVGITNPTIDFADATAIVTGSARNTSATSPPRLNSDNNVYFEVNSTTTGTRATEWHASFLTLPDDLDSLAITYRGKNSRNCAQTLSVWDWTANSDAGGWLDLDTRSVGGTEVQIDRSPSGPLSRFVGGPSGDELRARIRCTGNTRNFYARGDLLRIAFTEPE